MVSFFICPSLFKFKFKDVSPPKSKPTPASSTAASILLNVLDDYIPPITPKKAKPAQPEKTVVKNPVSEVNQAAG